MKRIELKANVDAEGRISLNYCLGKWKMFTWSHGQVCTSIKAPKYAQTKEPYIYVYKTMETPPSNHEAISIANELKELAQMQYIGLSIKRAEKALNKLRKIQSKAIEPVAHTALQWP